MSNTEGSSNSAALNKTVLIDREAGVSFKLEFGVEAMVDLYLAPIEAELRRRNSALEKEIGRLREEIDRERREVVNGIVERAQGVANGEARRLASYLKNTTGAAGAVVSAAVSVPPEFNNASSFKRLHDPAAYEKQAVGVMLSVTAHAGSGQANLPVKPLVLSKPEIEALVALDDKREQHGIKVEERSRILSILNDRDSLARNARAYLAGLALEGEITSTDDVRKRLKETRLTDQIATLGLEA